jgi:hypothetical protein
LLRLPLTRAAAGEIVGGVDELLNQRSDVGVGEVDRLAGSDTR